MSVPSSFLSQEEDDLTLEEGLWLFLDDREPVSQITADIHRPPTPTSPQLAPMLPRTKGRSDRAVDSK